MQHSFMSMGSPDVTFILFLLGWSSSLLVSSWASSQFPPFLAAPFSSELFCFCVRCLCSLSSCFSLFSPSRCLFSTSRFALSSAFFFSSSSFFFCFCSLSCFHLSFSSSSCFFFKAFSSRNLNESALVRTLAPETVCEDFLDFGVTGTGLTR